jgi:threonylcarbamoyladenosine tRNA methylthiotransferase MtaB
MRRKYTVEEFGEKIRRIRQAMPDVAITTDVIVGFPGESLEQFEMGYAFMKEIGFSEMHVFPYSKRSGTPAARMDDQVDEEEKNRRVHELIDLSEQMQVEYGSRFIGKVVEVIPEREVKGREGQGTLIGHSDNYLHVEFAGNTSLIGDICRVRIDRVEANVCHGTLV